MAIKQDIFYELFEKQEKSTLNIEKVIEFACNNLDADKDKFMKNIPIQNLKDLSVLEVLDFLKNKAISMTNINNFFGGINNLVWKNVASRIQLISLYYRSSITKKLTSFGYSNYYDFVEKAVVNEIYDTKITDVYTKEEILELGNERNIEYDLEYDYSAINLFERRYCMKLKNQIFELPQDMYATLALYLAMPEKKENRIKIAKEFYHQMGQRKLSPGTPMVLNLRRPNGNLSSCFITSMDDSLSSIYYTLDQVAQISKNAGGVGLNISRVRSQGSYIKKTKGASGGIAPWIKLINDTAVAVNQLGSRSGAVTVALDVWHRDILSFLELQTENGDHRRKAFDIFPQIVVTDEFMRRVEQNKSWTLFDPKEIRDKFDIELAELYGDEFTKTYKELEENDLIELKEKVMAKDLFKTYLKVVVETGMPYCSFKDEINNKNPNKHNGMIGNTNLCTESFSNFKPSKVGEKKMTNDGGVSQKVDLGEVHTCNLVSLNLAQIEDSELEKSSRMAVRLLDNAIEMTQTPLPESNTHNDNYRILGVGSLGLADYLVKHGHSYTKSAEIVDKLFEKIALSCVKESVELSEERGPYTHYQGSEWSKGIYFGKTTNELSDEWKKVDKKRQKVGMRNGGLLAIAPNTSTSLLMGSTASVLPIYKKFFLDKSSSGTVPISPPFLSPQTFWLYKENQNINQQSIVDITSSIQKWVDQGISMELLLNLKQGVKAIDLYNLYINAWKKKCKTVYYVRSIVPNSNEDKKEDCVSCAN